MKNILRIGKDKFKTKSHISSAVNHNMRLHIDQNLHERIYPEKSKYNELLVNPLNFDPNQGASDFQEKLFQHYDELGIKIKTDNVLMLEFMISASPEFFQTAKPEKIEDWKNTQVEFLKEQFGSNLKLVVMHSDESTPHLHIFVSTELKSIKKYKNQKGEFFKETWSLNAKRFDPEFLVKLHDAHAVKNDRFGLIRGLEGSTAEHVTLKDYTTRLNRVLSRNYGEVIADKLENFFKQKANLFGNISVERARKTLVPFLSELKADLECLKFHIKDKKKRNKLLEEEAKRLRNKEKEMDKMLDQATQSLKSKNILIDELQTERKDLKESNISLSKINKNQGLQIVDYQNELKKLRNGIDHN